MLHRAALRASKAGVDCGAACTFGQARFAASLEFIDKEHPCCGTT